MLNLFYKEPEGDRWLPCDRYPRRVMRRLVHGPKQPGGMERYFLNLKDGLDRLSVPNSVNSMRCARADRKAPVCIVGKSIVLSERTWKNPILFGPAVASHPIDDMAAFAELPIRKILVSCDWLKAMYRPHLDIPVEVWPSGIDTYTWHPHPAPAKDVDVLVYDKIRWDREQMRPALLQPILSRLNASGLRVEVIRYGYYREAEFRQLLAQSSAMIFLVEHETQGFAYLQTLSCDVPIFAWDRGGPWQDPSYYPHKVTFEPVTSVPYWDDRCGMKFKDACEFAARWDDFWEHVKAGCFAPRNYVLENLTLEKCAGGYVEIARELGADVEM